MIERRPFESLGGANHGWLNAKRHFSFANYYDPSRMGWGAIRVWNDDVIATPSVSFRPGSIRIFPAPTIDSELVRVSTPSLSDSLGSLPLSRILNSSRWVL